MPQVQTALLLLIACALSISACAQNTIFKQHLPANSITDSYRSKGLELLSVYQFNNVNNQAWFHEFSALAWDYDENLLYSITDNGHLMVLQVTFDNAHISDIKIRTAQPLQDSSGQALTGTMADSEGLALRQHNNGIAGDTELLVSFEQSPRIVRYCSNGQFIETLHLPKAMTDMTRFASPNKQFEALTEHSQHGLVFGPERPMDGMPDAIPLFNQQARIGQLNLNHAEHGSLVGLTSLPNGNLLALERVFINVFTGLQFHLHLLSVKASSISQTTLFSSAAEDGYFNDNFEGITHHKDNYFFMVSDDNQNAYQRTLLVYFRLPGLSTNSSP